MKTINALVLQKLVDNELDESELTDLTSMLKSNPAEWTTVGQAFLEKQILDRSISQVVNQKIGIANELFSKPTEYPQDPSRDSRENFAKFGWLKLLGLAACLLFALATGFALGQFAPGQFAPVQTTSQSVASTIDVDNENGRVADSTPNSEIFDKDKLEEILSRSWTPVPLGFKQELLRGGYVLEEFQAFTKVGLPDGDSIDVPVRKVNIQYLGQAAYQ